MRGRSPSGADVHDVLPPRKKACRLDYTGWFGVVAPAELPRDVARLNAEIARRERPELQANMRNLGVRAAPAPKAFEA